MNSQILVTGFKPFLHHSVNSSEKLLNALHQERKDITPLLLPVSFQNSFTEFKNHWKNHGPYKSVLMLGQAQGRKLVSLERVALNWMESKSPDNDGDCPRGERIFASAPDSYLVDFFPSQWMETLTETSFSAGTYVCNNLYFKVLHELRPTNTKALFVHLPLLPEQTVENPQSPSMALETQKQALHEILNLMAT